MTSLKLILLTFVSEYVTRCKIPQQISNSSRPENIATFSRQNNLVCRFDAGRAGDDVGRRDRRLRTLQSSTENMQSHFDQWLPGVCEHEVVVRHSVANRVISTDDVQQRGEEWQSMSVLSRRKVRDPLVATRMGLRYRQTDTHTQRGIMKKLPKNKSIS